MTAPCPRCGAQAAALPIHDVEILPAFDPNHRTTGLIGWARILIGPFRIDGLAVRRRLDGRWIVTWPARRDAAGRMHPSVIPIDDEVRRRVEDVVLTAARKAVP